MNNILETIKDPIFLQSAKEDVIKAVQVQLAKTGLYAGAVDGIVGPNTLAAFGKFKQHEYLEHLNILGPSTALALLNIDRCHPEISDNSVPDLKGVERIPGVGLVNSRDLIPGSVHFTWGELTKGLDRLPETKQITQNLIRLAQYLDLVRERLDNRPITILSGLRPAAINRACGGVPNSRHVFGDAADFLVKGLPPHFVFQKLDSWHGNKGGLGDSHAFTHVDLRGYRARWNYGNA